MATSAAPESDAADQIMADRLAASRGVMVPEAAQMAVLVSSRVRAQRCAGRSSPSRRPFRSD